MTNGTRQPHTAYAEPAPASGKIAELASARRVISTYAAGKAARITPPRRPRRPAGAYSMAGGCDPV
jgi:hypothetical protein